MRRTHERMHTLAGQYLGRWGELRLWRLPRSWARIGITLYDPELNVHPTRVMIVRRHLHVSNIVVTPGLLVAVHGDRDPDPEFLEPV